MSKYLIKLNEHTSLIKEWESDDYIIQDVDGNQIEFSEVPDYIAEFSENNKKDQYYWRIYPKDFDLFRDEFWAWVSDSPIPLEEILKEFKTDEKVDILSVNEIQTRLHKN